VSRCLYVTYVTAFVVYAALSRPHAAVLTRAALCALVVAVVSFDKDRSGTIDVWELRQVLEGESNIRSTYSRFVRLELYGAVVHAGCSCVAWFVQPWVRSRPRRSCFR
jgi:hypothetical protein